MEKKNRRRGAIARITALAWIGLACYLPAQSSAADDWPVWGRDGSRNMVSSAKGLPTAVEAGKPKADGVEIDLATTKNVKWVAKIGNHAYGNPTVAGGRVFVGINNGTPRDEKVQGDYAIALCLDEKTGGLNWQLACPKLAAGKNLDPDDVGLCSSPAVDGDFVYVVTNRCEVLCLDVKGLSDGNAGPFVDEAKYIAGPGKDPVELGMTDADIVWRYDLRYELGIVPHQAISSSVLVVGDHLFVNTCNGADWTEKHIPMPTAPALVCLDKKTGKLLGQEHSGISGRTFSGSWSSPSFGVVAGKPAVVFGAGDGFCYGFDPEPDPSGMIKELWRVDCNPPDYRATDGKPVKYRDAHGPSEILASPVIFDGKAFVAVGQDPDHNGDGAGCMTCIGEKAGKVDAIWRNTKVGRSMSTASIADGLLYVADGRGFVYCLDAGTGKEQWQHDAESPIWGSTLLADGKIFVGTEAGEIVVLAAGKEKKPLPKIDLADPIHSTPVVANGVMYVATDQHLYALQETKK